MLSSRINLWFEIFKVRQFLKTCFFFHVEFLFLYGELFLPIEWNISLNIPLLQQISNVVQYRLPKNGQRRRRPSDWNTDRMRFILRTWHHVCTWTWTRMEPGLLVSMVQVLILLNTSSHNTNYFISSMYFNREGDWRLLWNFYFWKRFRPGSICRFTRIPRPRSWKCSMEALLWPCQKKQPKARNSCFSRTHVQREIRFQLLNSFSTLLFNGCSWRESISRKVKNSKVET